MLSDLTCSVLNAMGHRWKKGFQWDPRMMNEDE